MKRGRFKIVSANSKCAIYRWDAHTWWNRESKKACRRELKRMTRNELRNFRMENRDD